MTQLIEKQKFSNQQNIDTYDVVICGGGLAGMSLARQLRLNMPDISILVLDRLSSPLPTAAYKVGESTVEAGAYYLANTLQLPKYFEEHHYIKLGLRFFYGNTQGAFKERAEVGLSEFHEPHSFQIDRGVFEQHLRDLNVEANIKVIENCSVRDIALSKDKQYHTVFYKQADADETQAVKSRWVVDAMGRRRYLQKKLGLTKPSNKKLNAAWFRIDGRVNVSDLVPETEENWHNRVPNDMRYYSTNHLVGEGYWIWLIPLSSGYTSIGIVASENVHSFEEYHTCEKAFNWLEKHEPELASYLKRWQPSDFKKMPNYSYSSTQIFSINRWACVGEAGTFADPLYSPGTDMIGHANTLTTEIISLELNGKLTKKIVDDSNLLFLTFHETLSSAIQFNYQIFGKNSLTGGLKFVWDCLLGWGYVTPLIFNSLLLYPEKMAKIQDVGEKMNLLIKQIEQLMSDWSTKSLGRGKFEFIDHLAMPFLNEFRTRNLKFNKTDDEIIEDQVKNLEVFEELAQVLFLLALEDTMPDQLALLPSPVWLNAWAISLDINRWECDGLFKPRSQPRDLHRVMNPLRKRIRFNSLASANDTPNVPQLVLHGSNQTN
jgi:flavin-dependent dehydrogenase